MVLNNLAPTFLLRAAKKISASAAQSQNRGPGEGFVLLTPLGYAPTPHPKKPADPLI